VFVPAKLRNLGVEVGLAKFLLAAEFLEKNRLE
jgi:hypothetical protein